MKHIIDLSRCISCGTCDVECPRHAIVISEMGKFSIDHEKCVDCGICVQVCPVDAAMKRPEKT